MRQYHRRDESKILPHVLVISIVSFCAISVLPYFWNYDVLDYSVVASVFVCRCLCNILLYLDQIALSMFHQ